jgi:hypothetical protein
MPFSNNVVGMRDVPTFIFKTYIITLPFVCLNISARSVKMVKRFEWSRGIKLPNLYIKHGLYTKKCISLDTQSNFKFPMI